MIYTITFNPSIDCYMSLPQGKESLVGTNYAKKQSFVAGGKGINVTRILNMLGQDSTALGFISGFTGNSLASLLAEEGIKTSFISLDDQSVSTRINMKLSFINNEEMEINATGPIISDKDMDKLLASLSLLNDGDIVVLSGSVPISVNRDIYAQIMKHTREVLHKDIRFVVDASGELLTRAIDEKPWLIKPNLDELRMLFGGEAIVAEDLDAIYEKAAILRRRGAANVIVSLGAAGALMIDELNEVYFVTSPKQETFVSSVGCGDCLVASFIDAKQRGLSSKDSLEFAVKSASKHSAAKR